MNNLLSIFVHLYSSIVSISIPVLLVIIGKGRVVEENIANVFWDVSSIVDIR